MLPHLPPHSQTKDSHSTAPGSPYSFRIVRGFFYVPPKYQHSRNCEMGPPAYRPYPRRLEGLTICRWKYKYFLLSYFKTLSVGSVGVSNSRPPACITARCTTKSISYVPWWCRRSENQFKASLEFNQLNQFISMLLQDNFKRQSFIHHFEARFPWRCQCHCSRSPRHSLEKLW